MQHSDDDELPQGQRRLAVRARAQRRDESEPLVHKRYADAFEDTDLEAVLAEREVGRLVVAGAQTDECIRVHAARCDRPRLRRDAGRATPTPPRTSASGARRTPDKVIDHTNLYWQNHTAPGRQAGTVSTDAVDFG